MGPRGAKNKTRHKNESSIDFVHITQDQDKSGLEPNTAAYYQQMSKN